MAKIDVRMSDEGLELLKAEAAKIEQERRIVNSKARFTASDLIREVLSARYPSVSFAVNRRGGTRPGAGRKPKGEQP